MHLCTHSPPFPLSVYPPSTPLPSSLSLLGDIYIYGEGDKTWLIYTCTSSYIHSFVCSFYNSMSLLHFLPYCPISLANPFSFLYPSPAPLLLSSTQLDVCRRNCLIYTVFKALLNQNLNEEQCQAICATNVRLNICIYA